MSWTSLTSRPARTAGAAAMLALAFSAAPAVAQVEGKFERTLKVSGTVDLSVSSGSGSIHVQPGPSGAVRVVGTIRGNRWRNGRGGDVESRVSIGKTKGDDLYENISISYDVYVPETTILSANTGSGSVQVGALRGPVTASSGSGSVEVGATGGAVKATSGSGQITVDGGGRGEADDRIRRNQGVGHPRRTGCAGEQRVDSCAGNTDRAVGPR